MGRWRTLIVILATWAVVAMPLRAQSSGQAKAVVDRAAELMGGEDALRGVRFATFLMMTQWQRTSFRGVPFTDRPSFEPHRDVRDYSLPAWRNTREFGARNVVNVIRDSVATTDFGQGPQPLSVAYVDEREELFVYTPDRLIVALLDAPNLARAPDTTIGDEDHQVVSATLAGRYPAHVYFHAGSGVPTMLRFTAGHPNDFGLVQWGEMDVEVWYSNWRTYGAISIPRQWDILRVGSPYKRMSVQSADFESPVEADSFAISSDMRAAYLSSPSRLPMHESRTIDEIVRPADGVIVLKPGFGVPAGAVDTGDGWLFLGAGQAPFNFAQTLEELAEVGVNAIHGVLIGEARSGNGGVVEAAERDLPVFASAGGAPFVETVLRNGGVREGPVVVGEARSFGEGASRVLVAPVDLPDVPGSLLIYKPSIRWLYIPDGIDPLQVRVAEERARELGWQFEVVGTPRDLWPTP